MRMIHYNYVMTDSKRAEVLSLKDEILNDMELAKQLYTSGISS